MLLPVSPCDFGFTYDNWGANPSATPGTSVTPGASNAEGSWTQIASSANIAQDCYFVALIISNGALATVGKNHLLDVGVDPAGGTSYTAVVSNFVCGSSAGTTGNLAARPLSFPLFIKAGSSVAVRVQGSHSTAGAVRVCAKFYGQPTRPENFPVCSYSETIGTITNSNGVSFTPGNAADGTWVSLGTTTKPAKWVQLGCQIDNGTMSAHYTYVDLAVGDGSNKRTLIRTLISATTSESIADINPGNLNWCEVDLPSGAELWIRGRNSAAPVSGYNGVAVIFG
jgi:hypothetical protein